MQSINVISKKYGSEFSSWLRKDKNETQAFCRLCLKSFSVASHGKTSLTFHASG